MSQIYQKKQMNQKETLKTFKKIGSKFLGSSQYLNA
jgi:hypothetical protein